MRKKKKTLRTRNNTTAKKRKVYKKKVAKVKKIKVPKTRNFNTLTESEYFSKIRSGLRAAFRFWKPMMEALKLASRPSQNKENKRLKTEYQCAHCKEWFGRKGVEIDHINPAGSLKCYEDVVPFIKNLTAENVDSYQILCKDKCHRIKTLKENEERKQKKLI